MKLQRRLSYKYKNKEHYKHVLVVPANSIDKLGWKAGDILESEIENGVLVIKPTKNTLSNSAESDLSHQFESFQESKKGR